MAVRSETRPTYPIRPGVVFPNWSVVTGPVARDALLAIFEVFDLDRCWSGYTAAEDDVRTAVLLHYYETGEPPTVTQLSQALDLAEAQVVERLRSLNHRDLVVFDEVAGALVGAYPFSGRETGQRVMLDGKRVNAMCAVDALGAGAMYGVDTLIEATCRYCRAPIEIATRDGGHALDHASPPETVVWTGIQYEGQAATSLCTVIAFFCSDVHLTSWRAANREERGFRLSLEEALETGMAIFTPFLAGLDAPRAAAE